MDPLGHVFLGVIAAAALAQVLTTIALLAGARGLSETIGARMDRLEGALRPELARLGIVADGLSRITDRLQERIPGIESAIGGATDSVRRTGEAVERVARRPAAVLAAALAVDVVRLYMARRSGRA